MSTKDELEKKLAILKKELEVETTSMNGLKLSINGSFGKLGSKYSVLYSPDLMLQVTISGQLCLLMLIETLELSGLPVVSGNTDGIIIKCPKDRYDDLNVIIADWEKLTGFETEETRYKATYNRDVNNFIIIKEDNTCKVKGCYSEKGSALNSRLSKNPEILICSDAVQAFLTVGTPIEETILNCKNFTRFVTVRNVKGGAEKDGLYLGKVVRYYFAKNISGAINYVGNGNKVPNSDGAKPCMDLPPSFPTDIDYSKYIAKANDILHEIGYHKKEQQIALF